MEPLPPSETGEDWRLGAEPEIIDQGATEDTYSSTDTSAERLDRSVAVVTVEHLAWVLITLWTLLTRLIAVEARPLSGTEAANGLLAYDLAYRTTASAAAGFHPTSSGWVHLLQAGIFASAGANDFTARLLYLLAGMLLVAMSFEMRHYIGRAGAIGMGAALAVSPTITWFSRAGELAIINAAAAVVILSLVMALCAQPSRLRAATLGITIGLTVASGPIGLMLAATMLAALAIFGIGMFFTTGNAWLRTRVWLDRYRRHVLIAILAATTSGIVSQIVVGFPISGLKSALTPLITLRMPYVDTALRAALLPFSFYEFSLLLLSLAGIVIVVAMQVRTRLARFTVVWAVLSAGLYLAIADRKNGEVLIVLVPAAILCGIAFNYFHRSQIWSYARYPIALLALLTIYVQVAINFIHEQPDTSEARWARHANLYWGDNATTIQAKDQTRAILDQLAPTNRTVFNDGTWPPALRWYLRDLRSISNNELASVAIDTTGRLVLDPNRTVQLDYAEGWSPDIALLNWRSAVRFFFLQTIWNDPIVSTVTIDVRNQAEAAPTLILPPPGK